MCVSRYFLAIFIFLKSKKWVFMHDIEYIMKVLFSKGCGGWEGYTQTPLSKPLQPHHFPLKRLQRACQSAPVMWYQRSDNWQAWPLFWLAEPDRDWPDPDLSIEKKTGPRIRSLKLIFLDMLKSWNCPEKKYFQDIILWLIHK